MEFRPYQYQKTAIDFIAAHPIAAVFLDMGMGKTAITLSALKRLFGQQKIKKVLVIAPLRVAHHVWPTELQKFSDFKALRYSVVKGTPTKRIAALEEEADIYIINRENVPWLVEHYEKDWKWDCLVVDELSSFKNYQAQRLKAIVKVRPKIQRVIGLTGTPASNGLMDLFAEYKVLDQGERLGKYITHYRRKYFYPDKRNGAIVYSYKPQSGAEDRIYEAVSDITISMGALDYLQMPEMLVNDYPVRLPVKAMQLYMKLKKESVLSVGGKEILASNAADLAGLLVQLASGAVYADDHTSVEIHDAKLDALEDLIEAANGQSLLVAYWYQHDYDRICDWLRKLKVSYAKLDSPDSIDKWNEGKLSVGLLHPASAGHGLNLQEGGNTLVWFSLPWSLEYYQQTNARLWRQGQKAETVVVIRLMAERTIDALIGRLLEEKGITQQSLLEAVKAEVENNDNSKK